MPPATGPASVESLSAVVEHGGDLDTAREMFPDAPQPWIDLSTGVNPHPYPVGDFATSSFTRLPDRSALAALEAAASGAYGAQPGSLLAAPGAQSLIQALPGVLEGRRVGVLAPTYCEHIAVWRRAGRHVVLVDTPDALASCDIGVIVNPNNPDGRLVPRETIARLARNTRLVVDESFIDLTPEASFAAEAPAAGVVVLRSFGKTYGLAGLRLGFAVGPQDIVAALRETLGPWSVSGPAIEVGSRALADGVWLQSMRKRLGAEAARLDALLLDAGFAVVGGTTLFRLAARRDALAAWEDLGRAGIYVRRFTEHPDWLRFGLPDETGWPRLEAALRTIGAQRR